MDLRLIWFENESIYHINHQIKLGNALLESLSEQSQWNEWLLMMYLIIFNKYVAAHLLTIIVGKNPGKKH